MQVVGPLLGHHFSHHASMHLDLWLGILGPINGSYTSDSTFSSCDFIISYYQLPQFSKTILHWSYLKFSQHVINVFRGSSQINIQYLYHVHNNILVFGLVQLCMTSTLFYHSCSEPFKYWRIICATSSLNLRLGSKRPDHTQISSRSSVQQYQW